MRISFLIILLAAITVSLVRIHHREVNARYRTHQLDLEAVALRRQLGNQQIRLGELTTPRVVWRRAETMALGLIDADRPDRHLAAHWPNQDR